MKKSFCVLIPAHNEEEVIHTTLARAMHVSKIDPSDIYLVDDGSMDTTTRKALSVGLSRRNILKLRKSEGKAGALTRGMARFRLASKYEWIHLTDADTLLDENYSEKVSKKLSEVKKDTAVICSEVKTWAAGWNVFKIFRQLEYFITHSIYKKAQTELDIITVAPGCGSLIRSDVFTKLTAKHDSKLLTEDMDWTIRTHKEDLGKVEFAPELTVYTQDPSNVRDYIKQIHRWYRGLWQVYRNRSMWNVTKKINFEASLLTIEGLFFGIFWSLGIIRTVATQDYTLSNSFLVFDIILFLIYILATCITLKTWKPLVLSPLFYPLRFLNCFVFIYSMIEIFVLRRDKWSKLLWNKVSRHTLVV